MCLVTQLSRLYTTFLTLEDDDLASVNAHAQEWEQILDLIAGRCREGHLTSQEARMASVVAHNIKAGVEARIVLRQIQDTELREMTTRIDRILGETPKRARWLIISHDLPTKAH
jgi:hypothetical protein